jgi:coproporphyrinogen III oxidase
MTTERGPDPAAVEAYLVSLQDRICAALESLEGDQGGATFDSRHLPGERGGEARPRVLEGGEVLEKAAVNFSHSRGDELPRAATVRRLELVGCSYEALSLSLIVHPRSPHVPTTHMNLRHFVARDGSGRSVWWFGGGFDLTPTYPVLEDVLHWHETAKAACDPFGPDAYARLKRACDEYFYLPHRKECRGVGGLFFDDHTDPEPGGVERCFALTRSVGDHFLPAYLPIVERRCAEPWSERQRDFQLYRRGRYAEFNLAYDRGTRHGLEAGGRTESILASLPPLVVWRYDWQPEPGSPEAALDAFVQPRDWLGEAGEIAETDGTPGNARQQPAAEPARTPRATGGR